MYGIGGAGSMAVQQAAQNAAASSAATPEPEITVQAPRIPPTVVNAPPIPFTVPPPLSPVDVPPIAPEPSLAVQPEEEIVVTANSGSAAPPSAGIWAPEIASALLPPSLALAGTEAANLGLTQAVPDLNETTALEKARQAKRAYDAANNIAKLLGLGAAAAGGAGGGGTVPGGLGELNPIFSAQLPVVNKDFSARPQGDQDWLTYGQRPEQSFFNYVPQKLARGGALSVRDDAPPRQSFAVNGAGTGRSDDIEALLSDGEYVMDAETVALLGDGSSKAGAQKLDDLRVKIRKHKGAKLARGRFSADAKAPEAYLTGGRIK